MIDMLMYGGGVQSVAMCILAARRVIRRPDHIVFADTGREVRSTHQYRDLVIQPYLRAHGMCVEVAAHDYAAVDLYGHNGDLLLPAHTRTGMLRTFCSNEWKARVGARYMRARYGYKNSETVVWLGFSYDELRRIKSHENRVYPLAALVMRRYDCVRVIQSAGLPVPRKSRCWCCPHQTDAEWRELPHDEFAAAAALEDEIHANDVWNGHNGVYLHRSRVSLRNVSLDGDEGGDSLPCQSGMCFV